MWKCVNVEVANVQIENGVDSCTVCHTRGWS